MRNHVHPMMTTMKTSAFSRVSARAPIASPSAVHDAGLDPLVTIREIIQMLRQTKNMSSTDFWSSASKKIAGA